MFGYKQIKDRDKVYNIFLKEEMKEWIRNKYSFFNEYLFNSILPEDIEFEITVSKKIKSLGTSYYKPYKIRINFRYDLPEIEYCNTLIHEMIHIWQYVLDFKDVHGYSFKKKAKEINRYGFNISQFFNNKIIDLKDVENVL